MVLCACTLFNYWVWFLISGNPEFCSRESLLMTRDPEIVKICRVYRIHLNFIKSLLVTINLIADIVTFSSEKGASDANNDKFVFLIMKLSRQTVL